MYVVEVNDKIEIVVDSFYLALFVYGLKFVKRLSIILSHLPT